MNRTGKMLLTLGATLSLAIALLHVGIVVVGVPAYLYFGTADLARMAAQGSAVPALLTSALAILFGGFGLYALSGAGRLHRLPWLTAALVAVGGVYTLRGLLVVPDLVRLVRGAGYPGRQTAFSAVALCIGLMYLVGTALRWRALRSQ